MLELDRTTPDALDQADTLWAQLRHEIAAGQRDFRVAYDKRDGRSELRVTLAAAGDVIEESLPRRQMAEVLPLDMRRRVVE